MPSEALEQGFLAAPEGADGPRPGVVMIPDVWGLSDHYRGLATRLAAEGFAVLAIDLYRRESEVVIENPGVFMRALSDPQVLGDLQQGVDFLAAEPCSADQRVGITGSYHSMRSSGRSWPSRDVQPPSQT